jgi:hypothetical protein
MVESWPYFLSIWGPTWCLGACYASGLFHRTWNTAQLENPRSLPDTAERENNTMQFLKQIKHIVDCSNKLCRSIQIKKEDMRFI